MTFVLAIFQVLVTVMSAISRPHPCKEREDGHPQLGWRDENVFQRRARLPNA